MTPAEGLPLSVTPVDGELVKVDVGAHVEHRVGEVAALSGLVFPIADDGELVERGASENATVCLVIVTTELFGIVCVALESAFLAGEGEEVGVGEGDKDEDVDEDVDKDEDEDEDEDVDNGEGEEEDEEDKDEEVEEEVEEEEVEEASGDSIVLVRVHAVELVVESVSVESVSGSSGMEASGPS
ncbi:hypothetical protein E4U33_000804 [Claviceps sp. LM78 group G4]|nr:hypothetical protein E4U33_000804 [Claviceps sp. LM78 group G4]